MSRPTTSRVTQVAGALAAAQGLLLVVAALAYLVQRNPADPWVAMSDTIVAAVAAVGGVEVGCGFLLVLGHSRRWQLGALVLMSVLAVLFLGALPIAAGLPSVAWIGTVALAWHGWMRAGDRADPPLR